MPGPMSAPNGDRRLVTDVERRRELAKKNQLQTGKTAAKLKK
jgi:hypothetical protein